MSDLIANSQSQSEDEFNSLDPSLIVRYLINTGWKQQYHNKNRVNIFYLELENDTVIKIIVPLNKEAPDFKNRISDVVKILTSYENRSTSEIINSIISVSKAILYIHSVKGIYLVPLKLNNTLTIIENLKNLMVSVASAEHGNKRYSDKSFKEVDNFIENCRLGYTLNGIIRFSIELPVPYSQTMNIPRDGSENFHNSFSQNVMERLYRCLNDVQKATFDKEVISKKSENGLNADICYALIKISNCIEGEVEYSIKWPLEWHVSKEIIDNSQICVNQKATEYLKYALKQLTRQEEKKKTSIKGEVIESKSEYASGYISSSGSNETQKLLVKSSQLMSKNENIPYKWSTAPQEIIVILPAYDEEISIGSIVHLTRLYADKVIVVDDGSADRTADIARQAGAEVIVHSINKGKGSALKTGFRAAVDMGADIIVTMDSDGQYNPADIPNLVDPIIKGVAEMVNGSRYLNGHDKSTPVYRRVGQTVLDGLTNMNSGLKITDSQSGFRAFAASIVDVFRFNAHGMAVESEMLADAGKAGINIKEIDIGVRYDVEGSTKKPIQHGLKVLVTILKDVEFKRPLLYLSVSGISFGIIGLYMGAQFLQTFSNGGSLDFGSTLLMVLLIFIGTFLALIGILFYSLSSVLRDQSV